MAFARRPASAIAGVLVIALCAASLAACGGNRAGGSGGLFRRAAPAQASGPTIGVNAYLWRASLDTLSFMPLDTFDPYGGIIMTDWYTNPEKPDERFKATVYILDTRLRADGINVAVHRQVRTGADWVDAATSAQTEELIENAILTRARQIRTSGR